MHFHEQQEHNYQNGVNLTLANRTECIIQTELKQKNKQLELSVNHSMLIDHQKPERVEGNC